MYIVVKEKHNNDSLRWRGAMRQRESIGAPLLLLMAARWQPPRALARTPFPPSLRCCRRRHVVVWCGVSFDSNKTHTHRETAGFAFDCLHCTVCAVCRSRAMCAICVPWLRDLGLCGYVFSKAVAQSGSLTASLARRSHTQHHIMQLNSMRTQHTLTKHGQKHTQQASNHTVNTQLVRTKRKN